MVTKQQQRGIIVPERVVVVEKPGGTGDAAAGGAGGGGGPNASTPPNGSFRRSTTNIMNCFVLIAAFVILTIQLESSSSLTLYYLIPIRSMTMTTAMTTANVTVVETSVQPDSHNDTKRLHSANVEEDKGQQQQHHQPAIMKRSSSSSSLTTFSSTNFDPIQLRPLDPTIRQHTNRPLQHLNKVHNVTLPSPTFGAGNDENLISVSATTASMKNPKNSISMVYFRNINKERDGLYPFRNYLSNFEGPVTYTWLAITDRQRRRRRRPEPGHFYYHNNSSSSSNRSNGDDDNDNNNGTIIIDAGMNTGFYSVLSAVRGYSVWSFDVQLDCFDVASILFRANNVENKIRMYHAGVWDHVESRNVTEGCDPGKGIDNTAERKSPLSHEWPRQTHNVPVVPLDVVLRLAESPVKNVELLKMDVEGAEIAALRGLSDDSLELIQNIVMECAPTRMTRLGSTRTDAVEQMERLVTTGGFVPYMLHQPNLMQNQVRTDEGWLDENGLELVKEHPMTHVPLYDTKRRDKRSNDNSTTTTIPINENALLWKVRDFTTLINKGPCRRACNLFFTKDTSIRRTF